MPKWLRKQYDKFYDYMEAKQAEQNMQLKAAGYVVKEEIFDNSLERGQRWRDKLDKVIKK